LVYRGKWTTWGEIEWRNVIRVLNLNSEFYRDSYFEGSRTDSARVNTSTSVIPGCEGDYLRIDLSSKYSICTGDTYLRLFLDDVQVDEDDDSGDGLCSVIKYHVETAGCRNYTLVKGCYGNEQCSGAAIITAPSAKTKIVSQYQVGFYEASRTDSAKVNTSTSVIPGCEGDYLRIDSSSKYESCTGDTYLRLFLDDVQVDEDDDSGNGLCSVIQYHVRTAGCRNYTLVKGCYGNEQCSGDPMVTVSVKILVHPTYEVYVDTAAHMAYGDNKYLWDVLMSHSKFDDLLDKMYSYAVGSYGGSSMYDW
jgi:hypothetical protein